MATKRFSSDLKYLFSIAEQIDVVCPRCGGKAKLIQENTEKPYYCRDYTFHCSHCTLTIKKTSLYEHVVKRNCPSCGAGIEETLPLSKHKKQHIKVSCKRCNATHEYKPRVIENYNFWYKGKVICFEYWYQATFKSHILWAMNMEHLNHLEQFIVADLRERSLKKYGMMYTERLPKWMQLSKNRASLLKTIKRLKEK